MKRLIFLMFFCVVGLALIFSPHSSYGRIYAVHYFDFPPHSWGGQGGGISSSFTIFTEDARGEDIVSASDNTDSMNASVRVPPPQFQTIYQQSPLLTQTQPPYHEKSASLAMLKSALLPGLGQFYVNKNSITAYVFSVIELGLWVLKSEYIKKGDNITADFEKFANQHYDINKQYMVQWHLMQQDEAKGFYIPGYDELGNVRPWGNGGTFRLDNYYKNDRQQFYEAIGKYERYVFGWSDWFDTYVDYDRIDWSYHINNIYWVFNEDDDPNNIRWIGNGRKDNPEEIDYFSVNNAGSDYREEFIQMRKDANKNYKNSDYMNFAIIANHALAAIDARRMANNHNAQQARMLSFSTQVSTKVIDNKPTPLFGLNVSF